MLGTVLGGWNEVGEQVKKYNWSGGAYTLVQEEGVISKQTMNTLC